jgi:hypothetical protein
MLIAQEQNFAIGRNTPSNTLIINKIYQFAVDIMMPKSGTHSPRIDPRVENIHPWYDILRNKLLLLRPTRAVVPVRGCTSCSNLHVIVICISRAIRLCFVPPFLQRTVFYLVWCNARKTDFTIGSTTNPQGVPLTAPGDWYKVY